jgi:hypothetical protein
MWCMIIGKCKLEAGLEPFSFTTIFTFFIIVLE